MPETPPAPDEDADNLDAVDDVDDAPREENPQSYYYDDAHGYADFDPDADDDDD